MSDPVRVRFCPSPTGSPHVGLARTALFNWAFARHHGGTFVFRIEDTDASRDSVESYETLLEVMRWLGFDWDEGPEVGGPFAPYRQSERYDVYADVAARLLEAGRAYHCYCSQEELDERNERARAEGRTPGYDGHCRSLTEEQRAAYEAQGRRPVVRFRMPDHAITFDDLVRGEITFQSEHVPDYVLVRGSGHPLYTLVNPVDDALMEITHVLRGEDLLSSTPRQLALYDALAELGIGTGRPPRFGHLPYVMGQGNKKLSKRDPESNLLGYRDRGFLPEGLLNYLALLGWAIADDRDIFSMDEMVEAFSIERVNLIPPASTSRRPRRSTRCTCEGSPSTTSPSGWCPTCAAPGCSARRSTRSSAPSSRRRRHWCRSGWARSRSPSRCSGSCSSRSTSSAATPPTPRSCSRPTTGAGSCGPPTTRSPRWTGGRPPRSTRR